LKEDILFDVTFVSDWPLGYVSEELIAQFGDDRVSPMLTVYPMDHRVSAMRLTEVEVLSAVSSIAPILGNDKERTGVVLPTTSSVPLGEESWRDISDRFSEFFLPQGFRVSQSVAELPNGEGVRFLIRFVRGEPPKSDWVDLA